MKTFTLTHARDGDLFEEDFLAGALEDAQALAVARINDAWGHAYADWDDMCADGDGTGMIEHPAVMAERLPLATVQLYRRLVDGLSDMIEGGRLTESSIPDDYAWLAGQLADIAAADPGQPELPADMTRQPEPAALIAGMREAMGGPIATDAVIAATEDERLFGGLL